LILVHFFIPLGLLVSRYNKRSVRALVWIAILILVARVADIYWNVIPMFSQRQTNFTNPIGFSINWLDIVAPIAIGGIWIFFFINGLKRRPVVALNDHRLSEVLSEHANH
jgi:amino acid transporter